MVRLSADKKGLSELNVSNMMTEFKESSAGIQKLQLSGLRRTNEPLDLTVIEKTLMALIQLFPPAGPQMICPSLRE